MATLPPRTPNVRGWLAAPNVTFRLGFIVAATLTRHANRLGKTAHGVYLGDLATGKHR
jgi:hypothetical protein